MEVLPTKWLSELEMEDPNVIQQYEITPFDYPIDELNYQCFHRESYSSYPNFNAEYTQSNMTTPVSTIDERPAEPPKTTYWDTCAIADDRTNKMASSFSQIICFDKSNSSSPPTSLPLKPKAEVDFSSLVSYENQSCAARTISSYRTPLHAQDHVIAERKRREKLSQRFIALSAIIPGLKKVDKASILGEAIKYLKQLEEKVKILEEKTSNKRTVESAVLVKKYQYYCDDDISSSDENFGSKLDQSLPEIEARVSGKDVLVRIHCENHNGVALRMLSEIEKLHLNIINSNVLPFGNSTLDITVVAQMDVGFCMTVKDLVRNLRQALLSSPDIGN